MISIYKKENTDFSKNGDVTLIPRECVLHAKINGTWEMTMIHPIDEEEKWKHIDEECVICAPTWAGKNQLFRIGRIEKTDEEITAVAYPIFWDSTDDCFLMDKRPEKKNGQQALDIMTSGTIYSGESDINIIETAYFVRRNLMDCINGEESPTFIQRWGGEIIYDNYKVIINKRIGGDYGVEVLYGKNMTGLSYTLDMSDVVTRIIPVSYNGYTLEGEKPWVDSKNIKKYAKVYTKEMEFDDVKLKRDAMESDEENGIILCDTLEQLRAELIKKCEMQFEQGIDLPKVTLQVEMVDLSKTEDYKDFKVLEQVGLGDTVHCKNRRIDIVTDARVIELTWDCIRNMSKEMKLGEFEYDYFDDVSSYFERIDGTIRPDGSVIGERIQGIVDGAKAQMRAQSSIAKKQDIRAMLFEDLDPESDTFGAMCLGTMGFQIASRRTADGRDWDWSTFGTGQGFFADFIVAGTMLADRIKGGTLELGGKGNGNGVARVIDGNGKEVVRLDNNGVYADGKYVSASNKYGRYIEISEGSYKIIRKDGGIVGEIHAISDNWIIMKCGEAEIRMLGDSGAIYIDSERFGVNGYDGKTGRLEFSDGTYVDLQGGIITGGNTKEGVF